MPMLVGDIVRRQSRINAKKVGLVDGDKQFTYKEVNISGQGIVIDIHS
jgi:hypothetical protein